MSTRARSSTGAPVEAGSHEHHLWDVEKVRALVADHDEALTFFCGGSRNHADFVDLFDAVLVLEVDTGTLHRRLDRRTDGEWGALPSERALVETLHRSGGSTPTGIAVDATRPLARVVDEILRLAAPGTAPLWLPALLLPAVRPCAEQHLVWLAAAGMDDAAFTAAAIAFADRYADAGAGRVAAPAVERVREHVAAGDRVVVATGCAAPLAQQVCAVAGLDGVEVVASLLVRRRWGPPRRVVPARGAGKLRALVDAGVVLPVDHACSDSATDLPLLRAARTAHLVDPAARDLARLRAALGDDVEVLRWAGR